jgi:hypothetical protein
MTHILQPLRNIDAEKSEFAAISESLIPFIVKSRVFSEIANTRSFFSIIDPGMGKDNEVFLRYVYSQNICSFNILPHISYVWNNLFQSPYTRCIAYFITTIIPLPSGSLKMKKTRSRFALQTYSSEKTSVRSVCGWLSQNVRCIDIIGIEHDPPHPSIFDCPISKTQKMSSLMMAVINSHLHALKFSRMRDKHPTF